MNVQINEASLTVCEIHHIFRVSCDVIKHEKCERKSVWNQLGLNVNGKQYPSSNQFSRGDFHKNNSPFNRAYLHCRLKKSSSSYTNLRPEGTLPETTWIPPSASQNKTHHLMNFRLKKPVLNENFIIFLSWRVIYYVLFP